MQSLHYANMSMQYTAIFHGYKNGNFQLKNCDIFLIFAQNIYRGYTSEPPQCLTEAVLTSTNDLCFGAKLRKKVYPCKIPDVPRRSSYGLYISQLIRFARVCSHIDDLDTRYMCLTAKLLNRAIGIIS